MGSRTPSTSNAAANDNDIFSRMKAAVRDQIELKTLTRSLSKTSGGSTRMLYANRGSVRHISTVEDLLQARKGDEGSGTNAICVIENVSPSIIRKLAAEWDLDEVFLVEHFANPTPNQFWHYGGPSSWAVSQDNRTPPRFLGYHHLHGVFEYHGDRIAALDQPGAYAERSCFQDERKEYPMQSNTKISYCLIRQGFYLFLVDPPCKVRPIFNLNRTNSSKYFRHDQVPDIPAGSLYPPRHLHPTLHLMCTLNRGGLRLNQLLDQKSFNLFELFDHFFRHGWHFDLIFYEPSTLFPGPALSYTLSNFINECNLRFLTHSIRSISFNDLRTPTVEINNSLHDRREDLVTLQDTLTQIMQHVPPQVKEYFTAHPYYQDPNSIAYGRTYNPVVLHTRILSDARDLETFLMHSFTLLMSSLGVQDNQRSLAQAVQAAQQSKIATLLAVLATFFLPASLVTGIFGMNLQELNKSGVHVWVCVVTALVVGTVTMLPLLLVNKITKMR